MKTGVIGGKSQNGTYKLDARFNKERLSNLIKRIANIKGQGLYRNFYSHNNHVKICEALGKIEIPWIVSYDNSDEIKFIYPYYRQDEYFLSYSTYNKTKGSEVMIYGNNIMI